MAYKREEIDQYELLRRLNVTTENLNTLADNGAIAKALQHLELTLLKGLYNAIPVYGTHL